VVDDRGVRPMLSAVHGMAPTDVKRYSLRRQSVLLLGTSDATEGARFQPLPTSRRPPSSTASARPGGAVIRHLCLGAAPPHSLHRLCSPALLACAPLASCAAVLQSSAHRQGITRGAAMARRGTGVIRQAYCLCTTTRAFDATAKAAL